MPSIVTLCTYMMRWLDGLRLRLQLVGENTGSDLVKLIAFFLCSPCFKASHFFFKIAFILQQRKLVALGVKCAALGGKNLSLQFSNLTLHDRNIVCMHNSLKNIVCASECTSHAGYCSHINHHLIPSD